MHLAQSKGCRVTAVTLEHEGVVAGENLASPVGVSERVHFVEGDFMKTDVGAGTLDSVLTECVMSIFADKPAAPRHLASSLAPRGGWA